MNNDKKITIDWEKIELDYRAGIKTLREIAVEHGITHAYVKKRANQEGWARDLSAKIKAKADALVSKSLVTAELPIKESLVIEENAKNSAAIQISERKDVSKARDIVMSLFGELEHQVNNKELYEKLGEILESQDENKMREIYSKVISFGGRVSSMKSLADSLKTMIDLERRVYKIDDDGTKAYTFEDFLREERGRSMAR